MEGSSNQKKIRMLVYTGGSWQSQRTRRMKYDGHNIQKHDLEVPSSLTSFSGLKDLVRNAAGLSDAEHFKFTYEVRTTDGFLPISIRHDKDLEAFMHHVARQSRRIGLYLESMIMEGSSNQKIRMSVYTGGSWQSQRTRHMKYVGHNIREHVLDVASNLTSFSDLKDHVRSAAEVENFKFTYKVCTTDGFVPVSIRNDMHLATFMHRARMQSKPMGLYLE